LRWLREGRRRSPSAESRAALERARARAIELRNAQIEGKLMETEEAIAVVEELVGVLRTQLGGLPARCTRDLRSVTPDPPREQLQVTCDRVRGARRAMRVREVSKRVWRMRNICR